MVLSYVRTIFRFFIRPAHIIQNYRRSNLQPDIIAGLTVAVIMLPQAIAFALIAELPPQVGLYTAIAASIIGGLWGSSNQLQTGPTNPISLLVLSSLLAVAHPGTAKYLVAAAGLALMAGVFSVAMGIARLGVLVNFVSDSVIVGFTTGAGILIFVSQLRHLLRINIQSVPGLFETVQLLKEHLSEIHIPSLILGLSTIAVILLSRKLHEKLPAPLIAMVVASVVVAVFGLTDQGVKVISELPGGLPPVTRLTQIDINLFSILATKALAVAAFGLVESMSIARVIASQTRQRLDSNQEFVGQGLANIASGLLSGYPSAGSFTRSAVNFQAGARTSISSVFAGILVLVVTLTLGKLATFIPLTALAGVLILTAYRLIDRKEIATIWRGSQGDRFIMVVTLIATLVIPLEYAVWIGIGMSLVYYILQTSTPRVRAVSPDANFEFLVDSHHRITCPQLGIVEVLGDLYFGAVHHVEDCIQENRELNPGQRFMLLRLHGIEHIDISGIHALEGIVRSYRERNGDVFIARYRDPAMEIMQSTGFYEYLGSDHFMSRDYDAIGYLFYRVLDPAICIYECPVRAFKECQNLPKRLDLTDIYLQTNTTTNEMTYIEPHTLWADLHGEDPPLIIDVREPREFKQGHIPEARLISLPDLLTDTSQVPRVRQVVLLCRSGRRSTKAASVLCDLGYDNVMALRGGMLSWEATNFLEAID